ncbi:MAG: hypothetical protein ABIR19_02835 [Ginsengibacter sp.]
MHFFNNQVYHIYNRGNDKQLIFFNEGNYLFFLKKIRNEWLKYCEIICYCLMPNHFHLMIKPNDEACINLVLNEKETHLQNLSKAIGQTLSSYTKAINNQNNATGNLFQKKTQGKCLSDFQETKNGIRPTDYFLACFHYIHQNPLQAKLVNDLKDWPYSSYPDYNGYRNGTLCNKELAMELMNLSLNDLRQDLILKDKIVANLF